MKASEAEVDAAWFGGYVKPANLKRGQPRSIAALVWLKMASGKAVIIVRERNGNSVPAVFKSESARRSALSRARIAKGTKASRGRLARTWDDLHRQFRDEADRPFQSVQLRWRVHEHG